MLEVKFGDDPQISIYLPGHQGIFQNFNLWGSNRPVCTVYKKWSFLLRIFSINVTKSAVSSGFGHIYWRNP